MRLGKRMLIGLALLAAPAAALAADEATTQPADTTPEKVMTFTYDGGANDTSVPALIRDLLPGKLEKAAYLGVGVGPAGPALEAQLKLPKNTGLLASYVDPDGPAKSAGIVENDVLTRFNDQILIDERQLSVLVHDAKPGDEVKLTVIHEGQPHVVTAKLVEKEMPALDNGQVDDSIGRVWRYKLMPGLQPQEMPKEGIPLPVPFGLLPNGPANGGPSANGQMQMQTMGSDMTVAFNGRVAHLHTDAKGLTLTITDNGKTILDCKAASLDDLRKNNPEAYKQYEKYFKPF